MKIDPEDIIGSRFGRLRVTAYVGRGQRGDMPHEYACTCDCGNLKITNRGQLMSGKTKSCGCYRREICGALASGFSTHGETSKNDLGGISTPEYRAWASMKARCCTSTHPAYHNYGGRGITVAQEWMDSFERFLSDVGRRPSADHSLDRKDNDLGYFSGNVIWSTRVEQGNNRRTNRVIQHNGRRLTLTQWAAEYGVSKNLIHERLKRGWSIKTAIETPARGIKQHEKSGRLFDTETCLRIKHLVSSGLSRSEVARMYSVTMTTISRVVDNLKGYQNVT